MLVIRKASHQGSKHRQIGVNNQDGALVGSFSVAAFGKRYHIGIVTDGCTGIPAFSRSEVGASLLPPYCYARIQELVCAGVAVKDIPQVLFQMVTEFIRRISHEVMPSHVVWPYEVKLNGREHWDSTTRFRADYLSATLLGFVTDETDIVIVSAGDGTICVNGRLEVIDQNDRPEYPASSINSPGRGFQVRQYALADIESLVVATDGLERIMQEQDFLAAMFAHQPSSPFGLQVLLNNTFGDRPELMQDDCTAITLLNSLEP